MTKIFSKEDTLAIKGIAILLMFYHHSFLKMERFEKYTISSLIFSDQQIVYLAQFCKICVGIFVFLSAYGMTFSYRKKSLEYDLSRKECTAITVRRYLKMMSGYWFIFVLVQIFAFFYDRERIFDKYSGGVIEGGGKFFCDMMGLSDLFRTPKFIPTWWYMSLAIVLIFVMPFLLRGYAKIGALMVPLAVLLPRALHLQWDESDLLRWMLCIMLGIWFADRNIFERIMEWKLAQRKWVRVGIFLIAIMGLLACIKIRQSGFGEEFMDIMDGVVPAYVILFSYLYVVQIKYLRQVLMFLGKHSMNMFLTHTFLRAVWFDEYIYAWNNVALIVLVLTLTSLALSIVIEFLKKILHYNALTDQITQRAVAYIYGSKTF